MVRERYRCGDKETLRGKPVYVKDPMTGYEMRQLLDRAERLLDALDSELRGYPVDCIRAYGSLGRVGVRVKPHDPLDNGIITGNIEGFEVEAVRPVDTEWVYIRFAESDGGSQ